MRKPTNLRILRCNQDIEQLGVSVMMKKCHARLCIPNITRHCFVILPSRVFQPFCHVSSLLTHGCLHALKWNDACLKKTLGTNECLNIAEYLYACWRRDSHMKGTGMFIVSRSDVKLFLVSHWVFSEQNAVPCWWGPTSPKLSMAATGWVIALSLSYDSFPPSPNEGNLSDNNPHSYEQYLSRSKLITVLIPYIEIETVPICSPNTCISCIQYTSGNSSSFVAGRGIESQKKFRVYAAFSPRDVPLHCTLNSFLVMFQPVEKQLS